MTSFLSINQLITLWFVDAEFPCFSVKFKKLGWWERQYHVKDTSILISTQHVKVVKCLIHIWQTPPGNPRRDDIQQALAGTIARCSLLLLGSDARIIIMLIIQRVWGGQRHNSEKSKWTAQRSCPHPTMPRVTIQNCHQHHLWATTNFDNALIINNDTLHCHPSGLWNIIRSLQDPTTAKYVCALMAPGTKCINILIRTYKTVW